MRSRRAAGLLATTATAMALTGCGLDDSKQWAETLAAAPTPADAVFVGETATHSFEQGTAAVRRYSLPQPIETACPAVLTRLTTAGYTVVSWGIPPRDEITDIDGWCETALAEEAAKGPAAPHLIATVLPPGVPTDRVGDGFDVVLTTAEPGDPHPDGVRLRFNVGCCL